MREEEKIEKWGPGKQENKAKKSYCRRFLSKIWECILYLISLLVRLCRWIYNGILWLLRGCKGKKKKGSDSDIQMETPNHIGKEKNPNSGTQKYINNRKIPNLGDQNYLGKERILSQSYLGKEGIPNIGNTCCLNSVLQILASTKEFRNSLNSDYELSCTLTAIISMINRDTPPSFEQKIRKLLKFIDQTYSYFTPGKQNDSKEIFGIIIDKCAENNEILKEIFFIRNDKSFECESGHIEKRKDVSAFLIVPQKFSDDLSALIKSLEQPTLFNDNNKLYCNTCQGLKDTYTTGELTLPSILAFYFCGEDQKDRHVKDFETIKGQEYKLYGLICFYPSYRHYVAFTLDNGIWMKYDDAHVSKQMPDYYYAYMAFYRRVK